MRAIPFFLILLWAGAIPAQAESYGPTEEERAMLPPYCGGPGGAGVDWRKQFGEAHVWNNHTCYGINRINRYYRSSRQAEKKYHLQTALQDFNYSVDHLPQQFPIMPEILYYRGLVHKLQGNIAGAVADWQKSISLDRRYSKSIVDLADLYAGQMKKPALALELVTEGLRDNPESKALKDRYTRYGGKLPYPEPRVSPQAEEEMAGTGAKTEDRPAEKTAGKVQERQAETVRPDAAPTAPATGTAGNPWCRFCPEPAPSKGPAPSTP